MSKKIIVVLGVMLLMLSVTVAYARGHSASQLENAGWDCMNAGPSNFMHCFAPGGGSEQTVQVKVFEEAGSPYLGTELLIHEDLYNGQPCPQDHLATYDPVPDTPYVACHHFETGHH